MPAPGRTDESPASAAASAIRLGVLWMVASTLFFVATDSIAKVLIRTYPVTQIVWAYFTFQVVLVVLMRGRRVAELAKSGRPALQVLRSLFLLGSAVLFFLALGHLPLAEASALYYLSPVLVTALSRPLLGEAVGPRLWLAVAAGFAGVLVVIRPGLAAVQPGAAFALAAAVFSALYHGTTRLVGRRDAAETTLLFTGAASALVTSFVVPFHWVAPDAAGWAMLAGQGLIVGLGHFALIKAYRAAPAAAVAPFAYAYLLWAAAVGLLAFGEVPDGWTIAGGCIIAGSGLYVVRRGADPKRAGSG